MKVEITKKMVTLTGKKFFIRQDIGFTLDGKKYIGEILDIGETNFYIQNIICEKEKITGIMAIPYEQIDDKDVNFVYCD